MAWLEDLHKVIAETEPEKLEGLSPETLQRYRKFLLGAEPHIMDRPLEIRCRDHIEAIAREIELRRIPKKAENRHKTAEEKADKRHQESHGVGKKTLWWARIAGWAGIAAVLVGIASLIYQIYSSKVPPSTSATASPPTSLQTLPTTSVSPEPEATASNATPSPQPEAIVTPLETTPVPQP